MAGRMPDVGEPERATGSSAPETAAGAVARAVRRVLLVELALNIVVAGVKGGYGLYSGSLAVATDALHSLVDAGANLLGLLVVGFSARPPDEGHPYGHRKLELVAATAIGIAVGVTAVRFAWSAVEGLAAGGAVPDTPLGGFALLGFTLAINVFIAVYEARRARQLDSALLAADAAHTASDVAVTLAVLGSHAAARWGVAWADPVGALIVVAVIGRVSWHILATNVGMLMDAAVIDPDVVARIVRGVSGVTDCHRIRSRGTPSAVHLDLHVLMDGAITLHQAHRIAHEVEAALRDELSAVIDVTVHMEPDDDAFEGL